MATLPYNSTIYKDALTPVTCTILAGQTISSVLYCTTSSSSSVPIGAGTLVELEIPSGFVPADLTFLSVDISGVRSDIQCTITDGFTNTIPIIFKNVTQLKSIVFPPFFFYPKNAIKIVSSVVQTSNVIFKGLLQPITQGVA